MLSSKWRDVRSLSVSHLVQSQTEYPGRFLGQAMKISLDKLNKLRVESLINRKTGSMAEKTFGGS